MIGDQPVAELDARRQRALDLLCEVCEPREVGVQLERAVFGAHFEYDTLLALLQRERLERAENFELARRTAALFSCERWRGYRQRVRSLLYNLRHCPHLKGAGAALDVRWAATASAQELWPERWPAPRATAVVQDTYDVESQRFQCRRCGSRRIEVSQAQTRRADEGMTVFFYCHGCRARWRG